MFGVGDGGDQVWRELVFSQALTFGLRCGSCGDDERERGLERRTVYFLLIDGFFGQFLLNIGKRLFAVKVDLQCRVGGRREEGEDALVFFGEGLSFTPPRRKLIGVDDSWVCVFNGHFGGLVFDYVREFVMSGGK